MDNGRLGGSLRSKDYNSRLQLHRFIWFPSAQPHGRYLLTLCKELSQDSMIWPSSAAISYSVRSKPNFPNQCIARIGQFQWENFANGTLKAIFSYLVTIIVLQSFFLNKKRKKNEVLNKVTILRRFGECSFFDSEKVMVLCIKKSSKWIKFILIVWLL